MLAQRDGCVTLEVGGVCLLGAAFFLKTKKLTSSPVGVFCVFICVSEAIIP